MSGLLADLYSAGDRMKRKLGGLLSNPLETVALGSQRMAEDTNALTRLVSEAGYMPNTVNRADQSVLVSEKQKALARALLADKATEMGANMVGATVWHGSPHKFDKFDSSKIGTGEGKQQQGIGAYFAESPAVAQKYADKESWKRGMDSGYVYKVDVPDNLIASMANHDAPLSQQPEQVRKAVTGIFDADAQKALKDYHGWDRPEDAPFAAIMDALEIAKGNNRAATSEALRRAGVPGIRYLDGGSRSAGGGTSNLVVFPGNESLLRILERNGVPIK